MTLPTPIPIRKAGAQLACSIPKVYELIADGSLKSYKIGRRRFTTDKYIAECIETLTKRAGGRGAK